jgi:hypothetical protein
MASLAPISEAQLAANRENAKHSTGPRTAEAKSRTRLNGLRHGLTGQTVLLPDEDRAAYDHHHAALQAELKPEGVMETQIAHQIADDYWRLNRIKAIEDNIFAIGIEAHAGEFHENPEWDTALGQAQTYLDQAREINLLSLYESRLNRSIHNRHKELAELQRMRKVAASASPKRPGLVPTTANMQLDASGHGFGFSNKESAPQPTAKPAPDMQKRTDPHREPARAA